MELVNSEITIKKPLVWLEISRENLRYNVAQMKKLIGTSKLMAVVKANAYGLGSTGVAQAIEATVNAFGVVGLNEAVMLRKASITKPIVNLGIYSADDADALVANDICPTIFTYSGLKNFAATAQKRDSQNPVWIKIDTGLNRLGIPYQEALTFIRSVSQSDNLRIDGVYSTLTEDPDFDMVQLNRFLSIKEACQQANVDVPLWSIATSQAALLAPESCQDMVRLGITLLGYYPSKEAADLNRVELRPVATLKTRVAAVKELLTGEGVGYRKKFVARKKTRIAVLLPGYSYGLDPRLVNGGQVLIGGEKYPFVGGITATNSFVDIGENQNVQANDEVVIFGTQNSTEIKLEEVCDLLGQNEYEFLSRIPEKVQRVYV